MEQVVYEYLRCGCLYGYMLTLVMSVMLRHGLDVSRAMSETTSPPASTARRFKCRASTSSASVSPSSWLHARNDDDAHGGEGNKDVAGTMSDEDDAAHVFAVVRHHWGNVWWVMMRHANSITHTAVDRLIITHASNSSSSNTNNCLDHHVSMTQGLYMEWAHAVRELIAGAMQDSIAILTRPPTSRQACQWIWHTCLSAGARKRAGGVGGVVEIDVTVISRPKPSRIHRHQSTTTASAL